MQNDTRTKSLEKTQGISKIRPYRNQYEWNKKKLSAESKDWEKFQINNKTVAFNVLFSRHNNEELKQEYISNYNSELENQVLLLQITSGEKWHYLFVKNLPLFLRETTLKNNDDYFCILVCIHPEQKNKVKSLENV